MSINEFDKFCFDALTEDENKILEDNITDDIVIFIDENNKKRIGYYKKTTNNQISNIVITTNDNKHYNNIQDSDILYYYSKNINNKITISEALIDLFLDSELLSIILDRDLDSKSSGFIKDVKNNQKVTIILSNNCDDILDIIDMGFGDIIDVEYENINTLFIYLLLSKKCGLDNNNYTYLQKLIDNYGVYEENASLSDEEESHVGKSIVKKIKKQRKELEEINFEKQVEKVLNKKGLVKNEEELPLTEEVDNIVDEKTVSIKKPLTFKSFDDNHYKKFIDYDTMFKLNIDYNTKENILDNRIFRYGINSFYDEAIKSIEKAKNAATITDIANTDFNNVHWKLIDAIGYCFAIINKNKEYLNKEYNNAKQENS